MGSLAFFREMFYSIFNSKCRIKGGKNIMKYDLIALDLDGTTLNPQNTVNPAVKQAAAWARAQGVRIVISTGRIASEAAEFAEMLGTSDDLVCAGMLPVFWIMAGAVWRNRRVTIYKRVQSADFCSVYGVLCVSAVLCACRIMA